MISEEDKSFKKALKAYENQDIFSIQGDLYKKNKYSQMPENIQEWINRKNIYFIYESNDRDLMFSSSLAQKISEDFKSIKYIYDFLSKASVKIAE